MIFGINTTSDISKLTQISLAYNTFNEQQFRNITLGIYAKYHYKSCYYLYKHKCASRRARIFSGLARKRAVLHLSMQSKQPMAVLKAISL